MLCFFFSLSYTASFKTRKRGGYVSSRPAVHQQHKSYSPVPSSFVSIHLKVEGGKEYRHTSQHHLQSSSRQTAPTRQPNPLLHRNRLLHPGQPEKLTPPQLLLSHTNRTRPIARAGRQRARQVPTLALQPAINKPMRVVREALEERAFGVGVVEGGGEEGGAFFEPGERACGVGGGGKEDGGPAGFESGVFDADGGVERLRACGAGLGGADGVEEGDGLRGLEVVVHVFGELLEGDAVNVEEL